MAYIKVDSLCFAPYMTGNRKACLITFKKKLLYLTASNDVMYFFCLNGLHVNRFVLALPFFSYMWMISHLNIRTKK